MQLQPGDLLLLYSDGVIEAQNDTGDFYDEDRLAQTIQEVADKESVEDAVRGILLSVDRFIGDAGRTDDITIVGLKRASSPTAES